MRDAPVLSVNEREFVIRVRPRHPLSPPLSASDSHRLYPCAQALKEEARVDGRRPLDSRELRLQVSDNTLLLTQRDSLTPLTATDFA